MPVNDPHNSTLDMGVPLVGVPRGLSVWAPDGDVAEVPGSRSEDFNPIFGTLKGASASVKLTGRIENHERNLKSISQTIYPFAPFGLRMMPTNIKVSYFDEAVRFSRNGDYICHTLVSYDVSYSLDGTFDEKRMCDSNITPHIENLQLPIYSFYWQFANGKRALLQEEERPTTQIHSLKIKRTYKGMPYVPLFLLGLNGKCNATTWVDNMIFDATSTPFSFPPETLLCHIGDISISKNLTIPNIPSANYPYVSGTLTNGNHESIPSNAINPVTGEPIQSIGGVPPYQQYPPFYANLYDYSIELAYNQFGWNHFPVSRYNMIGEIKNIYDQSWKLFPTAIFTFN